MGLFNLSSTYTASIRTNDYDGDSMYFLPVNLMCLAVTSIAGFLSVKLHYPDRNKEIMLKLIVGLSV